MAQSNFSFNTRDYEFPLLSELQPDTTIIDSQGEVKTKVDRPSVAYCHNIMPAEYGIKSVSYLQVVPPISLPLGAKLEDVRLVYSKQKNFMHLAWDSSSNIYAIRPNTKVWVPVTVTRLDPLAAPIDLLTTMITVGNVRSESYIYASKVGCFKFDETTLELQEIELFGLEPEVVICVVGASGYLVAFTETAAAWSSTILPNDFEPSDISGAGGGDIGSIGGKILFVLQSTYGFLIYTESNIVSGTYTNNAIYPFKFQEVPNSSGGISLDYVAYETNVGSQIAFTKGGLQNVTSQAAKTEYPEITDFLSGRKMETLNEGTLNLDVFELPDNERMRKKIKTIAGRYVVISYGLPTTNFTHALVLDVALGKLGKLKFEHTDVFEFLSDQTETAKETMCFVSPNGSVHIVNTAQTAEGNGVVLFGKLRYSASRVSQLQEIELSNIPSDSNIAVYACPSLDGKSWVTAFAAPSLISDNIRKFNLRSTAISHNVLVVGTFTLVAAKVKYVIGGRR